MPQTPADGASQTDKAKSQIVKQIARIVRREGLDYDAWRYISRRVREECELRPSKRCRKLPRILTKDEFRRFYEVVDQAENIQHSLLLRLLFYTGVRVSELCDITIQDIDLESCRIRIDEGKGRKTRYVLYSKSFSTALRTYMATHPKNRWLFQTTRNGRFSTRRIQQIVKHYAESAGFPATPHTFRHQAITWLTRHSGLSDAELQLITGHERRETLAVYQHVALDKQLEERYQTAMSEIDL